MNRIFCLETEWDQTVQDLKRKPTVLSLLEFMEGAIKVPHVFRQVATREDFRYYIGHLEQAAYNAYDIVYLCFHGAKGLIEFADHTRYSLEEFAGDYPDIFDGRTVIFDSCSTLRLDEDTVGDFKKSTGARLVVGYGRKVAFAKSFVFELWLLNALAEHPDFGAQRLMALAEKEMPEHVKSLRFKAY